MVLQGAERVWDLFWWLCRFEMFDQLRDSSTPFKKASSLKSLLIKRRILPPSGLPGRKQPTEEPEHQQLQKPFTAILDQELQARCKPQLRSSSQGSETSENSGLDPGQKPGVAGIALGQLPPRCQAQMHTLKKMSNLL